MALARHAGDPGTLVLTLGRRFIAFPYADDLDARRATVDEMLTAAQECTDEERVADARTMRIRLLLERGRLDDALAEAQRLDRDADLGRGSLLFLMADPVGTIVATLRGSFQHAQDLLMGVLARAGARGRSDSVQAVVQFQLLALMREQGALDAVRAALAQAEAILEAEGTTVYLDAAVLLLAAELGRMDDATALLHRKVGPDLMSWTDGWGGNDMVELAWIIEACGLLGDATFAARLHELLEPAADRLVVASLPPVIAAGWGTMFLGITAGLLGRDDQAEASFADALAHHESMGAATLVARGKFYWARAIAARGDTDRARALAADSRDGAGALGMHALAEHAAALVDQLDRTPEPSPMEAATATRAPGARVAVRETAVFRREGEFWTVTFAGSTARLRDSKGMRHLAELLSRPGTERHALDLVATAEGRPAGDHAVDGDAGPVLDPQAKEAYRRRITELTEERDEAGAFNDLARAEKADNELDALIAQLSGAVGLGGRDRRAWAASERARISVSRSVKSALQRIGEALPELGAHLRATVRTGTFSSYTPDLRVPTTWELGPIPTHE